MKTKRYVQILDLKDDPNLIKEYKSWHQKGKIFPEVVEGMREVGILEMEIYNVDNHLVMIVEVAEDFDWDKQFDKLSKMPRQAEWESQMDHYQDTIPGATSDGKWKMLERFFALTEM